MIQAVLSPELTRQSIALACALSATARNWGLYPPEHPAAMAIVRLNTDELVWSPLHTPKIRFARK